MKRTDHKTAREIPQAGTSQPKRVKKSTPDSEPEICEPQHIKSHLVMMMMSLIRLDTLENLLICCHFNISLIIV